MKGLFAFSVLCQLSLFGFVSAATTATAPVERATLDKLATSDLKGFVAEMEKIRAADPSLFEQMADEQDTRNPQAYETYREFKYATAPTLEESLAWGTPAEIAADTVDENGQALNDRPEAEQLIQDARTGAAVNVTVHIGSQTIDIEGGGMDISGQRVATGRPGHRTPIGCHSVWYSNKNAYSFKYHAPMPYALFFNGDDALHEGSVYVKSHGCVHLETDTAMAMYATAMRVGIHNVEVCVVP